MLGTALAQTGTEQLEGSKPAAQNTVVPRKRGRPPLLAKSIKKAALVASSSSAVPAFQDKQAEAAEEGISAARSGKVSTQREANAVTAGSGDSSGDPSDEKVRKHEDAADLKVDLRSCLDGGSFDLHEELYHLKLPKNSDSDFSNAEFQKELENLSQLANSLRHQYRELERIGVSNAQENFVKYKIATDEKIQSCQEYSDYLEKKVEKLELDALKIEEDLRSAVKQKEDMACELEQALGRIRQLEISARSNTTTPPKTPSETSNAIALRSKPNADSLEHTLSLYRELTGVTVYAVEHLYSQNSPLPGNASPSQSDSDSLVFWCKQSGRNGQIHYSLVVPASALEQQPEPAPSSSSSGKSVFVYKPIKEKITSQNIHKTQKSSSEWHRTSVEFERKMASLFFWRLSSYLHYQG